MREHRLDHRDGLLVLTLTAGRARLRRLGAGKARLQQVEGEAALAKMAIDLAVRPGLEQDLAHRHGGQPERAQAADRSLLEQKRGAAHGDQIQERLVDLDRKVRTVEVGLHGLGHAIESLRDRAALDRTDVAPGDQAEPLRPRRCQLGEQRSAELLHAVQGGAVEQTLDRVGSRAELRTKSATALRQREGVALPPETLPAASALLGPLVPRPDGFEREVTHERFSAGGGKAKAAAGAGR